MHNRAVPFFKPPLPQPLSLYRDSGNGFCFCGAKSKTFGRGIYRPSRAGRRSRQKEGLKSRGPVNWMHQFTGRHRPRRGGAGKRQPPSPGGTSPSARGRPGPRGERGRGRQRTPAGWVSKRAVGGDKEVRECTHQLGVADQLASEPQEGLLEVVVGLGGDVVVLEVLLAVEGDGLRLDLALLHVDLVTAKNNGDVLADTDEVTCM
jgi:hypothetical protein